MNRGDHIVNVGGVFGVADHHGIYIGNEKVIHFSGEISNPKEASIRHDSIKEFMEDSSQSEPLVVNYRGQKCYPPAEVVRRAQRRVGQDGYSLTMNNCEHFAVWCRTGKHESLQVENLESATGLLNLVLSPIVSPIETIVFEGRCNCGNTLTGLTTVWLCENCGKRYCLKCIQRLKKKHSSTSRFVSDLIGDFAGASALLSDRTCHCGHVLDESQQIRKGIW